jgi:hypothetical protein
MLPDNSRERKCCFVSDSPNNGGEQIYDECFEKILANDKYFVCVLR